MNYTQEDFDARSERKVRNYLFGALGGTAALVVAGLILGPRWGVYSEELAGRAELRRAESNRQVAVLEANAKLEAAHALADAEIERARGVAEANKIIGDSLKGNESYLHWLWIDKLDAAQMQVLYVPTEANLPILEAGRRPEGGAR